MLRTPRRPLPPSPDDRPALTLRDVPTRLARDIFSMLSAGEWSIMPQTDKWHSKLLRPSTLPPSTIDIQSPLSCEQRSQIGAMLDYAASKNPGMQLKFGSCFEDRLSIRPYDILVSYKDMTSTSASERVLLPSRALQGS